MYCIGGKTKGAEEKMLSFFSGVSFQMFKGVCTSSVSPVGEILVDKIPNLLAKISGDSGMI